MEFKVSNDDGITAEDDLDNSGTTTKKKNVLDMVLMINKVDANQRPQQQRAQKSRRRNIDITNREEVN